MKTNVLKCILMFTLFNINCAINLRFSNNKIYIFFEPITINNFIKACFSNEKCSVTIQTGTTQIIVNSLFLIEKPGIIRFPKIICVQNQLSISFGIALLCNKILKVKDSTPPYNNFYIYLKKH